MKQGVKCFGPVILAFLVLVLNNGAVVGGETAGSPSVSAHSYILMDGFSGRVIAGKNENERVPMASTTKIMTALITLEQKNLEEYFIVDSDAIKIEGSSMGLMEGDQVSLRMLAYGMLLSSGNDAANAAAVKIAGSQEQFADLMNQYAKKIGMKNTNFVTPSGLHNDDHYSTAYDMALLAKKALENKDFAMICSCSKAKVNFGNPPFERWLSNHNRLLKSYDGCIGVKTGFTKAAGRCLVTAAERDGVKLICVTLNDPEDWVDHTALFDYGFSGVKEISLYPEIENIKLPVVGAKQKSITLTAEKEVRAKISVASGEIKQQVLLERFTYAPVEEGDVVGKVNFMVDGKVIASTPILAGEKIERHITEVKVKESFFEKIKKFFAGLF